jgi:ABC-2 type transport system ATP-binding protein
VALGYGLDESHTRDQIERLLAATRLEGAADRLAGHLSGGMRQKLGVAMALIPEPELIILDEPTTGVDPVSRLEIWAFIVSAAKEGCAVVLTTTYVEEAARTGQVLALEQGRTLAYGSPADVIGSLPGAIFTSASPGGSNSWRRGPGWRIWSADGSRPHGAQPAIADLDDVVTVAALRSENAG